MDSITQVLLGSAVAGAVAPAGYRKRAILTGAVLGTLPDLDVFLRYDDPVDNFTRHRGFSHSLLILPLFALLLMPLLRRWYHAMPLWRLYAMIALALVTHPLLDSLTAYGTQLLWPLPITPTFISSVFIVDPLYTVWLLIGVLVYLVTARGRWLNAVGLAISMAYLGLGLLMQANAKQALLNAYPDSQPSQWFVGAATGSPFCWHGVYVEDGRFTEVAFNVMHPDTLAEQRYQVLPQSAYPNAEKRKQLQWFNPHFTVFRERDGQVISSDLRMGEFGEYSFEFVLLPDGNATKQLSMMNKAPWRAISSNHVADDLLGAAAKEGSRVKYKWSQFMRCLRGGL